MGTARRHTGRFLAGLLLLSLGGCTAQMRRIETRVDENTARTGQLQRETARLADAVEDIRSLLKEEGMTTDEERAELLSRIGDLETNVRRLGARAEEQEELLRRIDSTLDLLARQTVPRAFRGTTAPAAAGSLATAASAAADTALGPSAGAKPAVPGKGEAQPSAPQPSAAAEDAREPLAGNEGSPAAGVYDAAFSDFTRGNYGLSRDGFQELLKRFPDSELADNAAYWIGETWYAQGDYAAALGRFESLLQRYPQADILPPTLLKIGYCRLQMGQQPEAVEAFRRLLRDYPGSDEAAIAENKLLTLGVAP